jgi:hypothetical protein
MLVFLAADAGKSKLLQESVRTYLAWESIVRDKDRLNLDVSQKREADENSKLSGETVGRQIKETYCWLLAPTCDFNDKTFEIDFDIISIKTAQTGLIESAVNELKLSGALIEKLAPMPLLAELKRIGLDNENHLEIKKLWQFFCSYCYMPRLIKYSVLEKAIIEGVKSKDFFAAAAGFSEGRYLDLKLGVELSEIDQSGLLVSLEAAKTQIEKEKNELPGSVKEPVLVSPLPGETTIPSPKVPVKSTKFIMSAKLSLDRINRDVPVIAEEILAKLNYGGVKFNLTLEVTAEDPNGIEEKTEKDVRENCRTLGINFYNFEK